MKALRSAKNKKSFPLTVEKNGRTGRIYQTGSGRFKTHFQFAGKPRQNMFGTFEAASEFLEAEFLKLDSDQENSHTRFPLRGKVKDYAELEQILEEQGGGATMREAR